ncbi:unnamed protein product [Cylindrotheca closterium]|uniref:Mechanosensitive ion channel MscS domain-containing protein n=1 Tax=Cylindrotheca closterium TaxID=2856 RepID=A0AAD2G4U5_9STRA|nr:unnamed protein product [Cylindrotheca closterium]
MRGEENDPQKSRASKLASSSGGLSSVAKASGKAVQRTANALNPTNLFKKSKPMPHKQSLYEELQTETAEEHLLESLEERGRRTVPHSDGFRPAVEGERAPLGLHSLGRAFDEEAPLTSSFASDYLSMARMAQQHSQNQNQRYHYEEADPMSNHQRAQSLLESINESVNENDDEIDDTMIDEEMGLQGISEIMVDESHPLLVEPMERGYSSAPYQRLQEARRNGARRRFQRILACLNPLNIIRGLLRITLLPFLAWALPLFVTSWTLFYYAGNPSLEFLPGDATISWWLNFVGRHAFLLQVSYIFQTILIDWIIMSSRLVVAIIGPWATIFCLQSRGWPFLVGSWGILAMLFLQGSDAFSQHWLHSTGIRIFNVSNSGSYIIASSTYLRVLIGMLLAGIATSLKRTIVTLYFGKRSFDIYKTKLEKLLNNVILVSEVAELSAAASDLPHTDSRRSNVTPISSQTSGLGLGVQWSSLRFKDKQKLSNTTQDVAEGSQGSNDDDEESEEESEESDSYTSDNIEISDRRKQDREKESDEQNKLDRLRTQASFAKSYSSLSADTGVNKHFKIKNKLGRWDDPLNKMDTQSESSVSDILKFRKALTYMDLEHPFSESFGPASTRDELLTSAQAAYSRLRLLAEGSSTLPFSVLAVLAENEDGTIDKHARKSLRKIFPPDRMGNVSLLTFVMGCDSVYKKLRYFRASVGNSSVIDKVLEDIIDTIFFFVLVILILALLNLNPWPLLVSTSTLLVTFAFAVGPSAENAIEGIILIVGRRPYDIGDRIIISDSPGGPAPGVDESWFVEDITLFSTTLRFGNSNEVATVSNGSIAQARITNCAKSSKATVQLSLRFHIKFHEGSNLLDFREALDTYVLNNPNRWDSISFFRCEAIDTDDDFVVYRLETQSTQSWQPAPRVLEHRAQLHRFILDLAIKMEVQYEAPFPIHFIYDGGAMVDLSHPRVNRAKKRQEDFVKANRVALSQDSGFDRAVRVELPETPATRTGAD